MTELYGTIPKNLRHTEQWVRSRSRLTAVLPIHNDAPLIPYALTSLTDCPINELIILLDRCDDCTQDLTEYCVNMLPFPYPVQLFHTHTQTWNHPIAEAFENVFALAESDIIHTMAADIIADPDTFKHPMQADLESYRYEHREMFRKSLHHRWLNALNRLPFIYTCKYGKWSGHFRMRRNVWEKLHYHDVRSPDLDFFNRAHDHGFTHTFYNSKTVHLRAGITPAKQWDQGLQRAETRVPLLKVLAHSVLELKPGVLRAYLGARKGQP